jgi:hypothetical protein
MKTVLVVVYLSTTGLLDVKDYVLPSMDTCRTKAAELSKRVKTGRVNTVCWRLK